MRQIPHPAQWKIFFAGSSFQSRHAAQKYKLDLKEHVGAAQHSRTGCTNAQTRHRMLNTSVLSSKWSTCSSWHRRQENSRSAQQRARTLADRT
jgi:hypothetical protein